MYCKECGKQIDNASKFCSYCGTKQSINQVSENKIDLSTKPDPIPQNVNISLSFKKPNGKRREDQIKTEKYDLTYKKNTEATSTGLLIVFLGVFFYFTKPFDYVTNPQGLTAIIFFISLIWRIIVTIWVVKIAKRQNRDATGWGVFAFLIPNLALIIIGLLKKLFKPTRESLMSESNQVLPKEDVSNLNSTDNVEVGATENFSHNVELESGTVSDNITYKVFMIEKIKSYGGEERDELKIKFSDGKIGKIFCKSKGEKYYIKTRGWRTYYINKEATIKALYHFLTTKRQLSEGFLYTE